MTLQIMIVGSIFDTAVNVIALLCWELTPPATYDIADQGGL
jgi:hypothetical protein